MTSTPPGPGTAFSPSPDQDFTGWRLGFLLYWIASTIVGGWIVMRGSQALPAAGDAGRGWYLLRLGLTGIATLLAGAGVWHLLRPTRATVPYWDRALPSITLLRTGLLLIGIVEWLSPVRPGHSTQSAASILVYLVLTLAPTVGWLAWWRRVQAS